MLYGLEIENFMSIREHQTIDLRVPPNVREQSRSLRPIWDGSKERAPSVVAFFGPNGAGKSNVLRALNFVATFVHSSFSRKPESPFEFSKFADDISSSEPTKFVLHFSGPLELPSETKALSANLEEFSPECAYVYELEIESVDPPKVLREVLSYYPRGSKKRVFERVGSTVKAGADFGLSSDYRAIDAILRPDASVISTLVQLNHPVAILLWKVALRCWSNIWVTKFEPTDDDAIKWYENNSPFLEKLSREISRLDIGIQSAALADVAGATTMIFDHRGLTRQIPIAMESHGTRQFIKIFPWIAMALEGGGLAIVDELDTSIHPLILPEIASWFYDARKNPHGAQLWITCQAASLLEDLSKEQIFFCEKDDVGRTSVFGLREIKNVRRVDNFYRKYISGVYGAIPRVG